jgi:hypothetical protein
VRLSCNRGSDLPAEFDEKIRASEVKLHWKPTLFARLIE